MNFGVKSTNSYTVSDDKINICDFVNLIQEEEFSN